jgi:tetratricopeptide (TPR) repeat protein
MKASQRAAIAQNNEAVSLIATGHYAEAISKLFDALDSFKRLMNATLDLRECQVPITSSLDAFMKEGYHPSTDSIPQENEQNYLYQRAIRIPEAQCGHSYRETVMASCIIVFNLALAHHLSSSLIEAVQLYELSFNIQLQEQLENNVLYTLAVVNNLGLVHRLLRDEEASGKCFQHVLATLMLLTDCGQASMGQLEGFFCNVTCLISETTVASAA